MHIRQLAVIRKKTQKNNKKTEIHTCKNVPACTQKHTQKLIFNIIMTSRTLQESQQDWDSTEG